MLARCKKLGLLCLVSVGAACGGDTEPVEGYDGGGLVTLDSGATAWDSGQDAFVWPSDTGVVPFDASNSADGSTEDGGASDGGARDGGARDGGVPDGSMVPVGDAWTAPAPRATCRPGDKADGTLAGLDGDFRCNLDIAGQVAAPHFLSLAWYKDCAYVNGADGTTVIHVSAAGVPSVITTLTEVGMRSNWESMKAHEASGLLAGYESNGAMLTVYDVSADCKAPVLQSNTRIGGLLGSIGHAGNFSSDGTIYYASSMYTSTIYAMDLAAPKTPVTISSSFERGAHDLFVGKQGTRGYFANPVGGLPGVGSLAILDLSQVQARKPDAKGTLIKEIQWEDGNVSQYPIAISYGGREHLMITDELGSESCANPKKPQWGYARILDISDEKNPKLVSLIKTEAQDPKNCMAAQTANGGFKFFGIGTHYCNVDRLVDPRVLMCGNWDAGLRVYDIRNPALPKEVAYFDTATANMPGMARLVAEKREIWLAVTPGTFYVLKIPAGTPLDQLLN